MESSAGEFTLQINKYKILQKPWKSAESRVVGLASHGLGSEESPSGPKCHCDGKEPGWREARRFPALSD